MSTNKANLIRAKNCHEFLQAIFDERKKKNSRYSLRSFARSLGMTHSYLSSLLSGKKAPTLTRSNEIALKLRLDSQESELFFELVEKRPRRPTRDMLAMSEVGADHMSIF